MYPFEVITWPTVTSYCYSYFNHLITIIWLVGGNSFLSIRPSIVATLMRPKVKTWLIDLCVTPSMHIYFISNLMVKVLQPCLNDASAVQWAALRHAGHRVNCNDFELEVDKAKVASLPTIMKLLITCHLPLCCGLHTGLRWSREREGERKNYGKEERMKEGGWETIRERESESQVKIHIHDLYQCDCAR